MTTKTRITGIRFTPDEHQLLEHAAAIMGRVGLSVFIRQASLAAAKEVISNQPIVKPSLTHNQQV